MTLPPRYAQQLVDRYNRQADRIEALKAQLDLLQHARYRTFQQVFAALPDGWTVRTDDDRLELVAPESVAVAPRAAADATRSPESGPESGP